MNRRRLIAAVAAASAVTSSPALASGGRAAPAAPSVMTLSGVSLPVIEGGRLRNYVFVSLRLVLGAQQTPRTMRDKAAFLRDALVRAAHRTPFTVAGDWNRLDERALAASLIRSADAISGRGSVARVEVVSQSPRRAMTTPRA